MRLLVIDTQNKEVQLDNEIFPIQGGQIGLNSAGLKVQVSLKGMKVQIRFLDNRDSRYPSVLSFYEKRGRKVSADISGVWAHPFDLDFQSEE